MAQYGVPNSEDPKKRVTNPFSYKNPFKNLLAVSPNAFNIVFSGFFALWVNVFTNAFGWEPLYALGVSGFFIIMSILTIVKQLDHIIDGLRTSNQIAASALNK